MTSLVILLSLFVGMYIGVIDISLTRVMSTIVK